MAKEILKNPVITIDGTDLTTRINQVELDRSDDEVDVSTFGSEYKQTEQGLKDATVSLTGFGDFAAASVDAVLWPLSEESKKFIVKVQVRKGEITATNPCYVMGGKLFNYKPLSGSVGEATTIDPTIKNQTPLGIKKAKSAAEVTTFENEIKALF
jgi:hypothetical protein